jgi:hypothetical protein
MSGKNVPYPHEQRLRQRVRRPFLVTLLAVAVLIMASINLLRFVQALSQWSFLSSLPNVSPVYLAISGLVWTVMGLPLAWGLWRGHPDAPKAARILIPLYSLYYWLDRILLKSGSGGLENWPFMAGLTLVLILLVYLILALSGSRAFYGDTHER